MKIQIQEIKERLDNCIDLYTDLFCKKQDCYAHGWIGDIKGGVNCFNDAFFSFQDIRLDLERYAPKGAIFEWYYDHSEINYNSYLMGLRVSKKPL